MSFLTSKCLISHSRNLFLRAVSKFVVGTDTIRDLWPEIGRPLNDISLEEEQLEEWQLVPDTFSGVCNWAELVMDEGECSLGKRHRLVYKHRDGEALFEVCIRAQGYVDKHSLGPLGNWNGYVVKYYTARA